MALSTETGPRHFRYPDLATFPDDHLRREIIDGELIVTAAPRTRHQASVMNVSSAIHAQSKVHGGRVFPAPTDVYFSDDNVVEPDVVFVSADHLDKVQEQFINGPPDLVVEISSLTTRRLELVHKRELYARFEVPEYWYVDLDADRVEIYRWKEGVYGPPKLVFPGEALTTPLLPGLELSVEEALGAPELPAAPVT